MKQRITLKDIAQAAGVSINTVSFVLHSTKTNVRVAAETAERIKQLAEELGYRSNREARALIAQRYNKHVPYNLIALFNIIGHEGGMFIIDPYFSKHILGILAESECREMDIVLCHANRGEIPRLLTEERVDGIISMQSSTILAQLSQLGLPIVVIGHSILAELRDVIHNIAADSLDGIRQTTRHLLELGHRHIAYLGQTLTFPEAQLRFEGYNQELAAHGIPFTPAYHEVTINNQSFEAGGEAMARLLARDPAYRASGHPSFTAVVCYNDCLAMGAMRYLQSRGLRIPDDISLVGYDDISTELGSVPSLTSVAYDRHGMGARAVQIIATSRDCQGDETISPCYELVPVTLVVRESTAPPPGRA